MHRLPILQSNLSITLITFALIQWNAFKTKGGFTYIKDLTWPLTNLLGAVSPLISLSMRMFGNILSGSILMGLVYSFTGWLSSLLIPFNFLLDRLLPQFYMLILMCLLGVFKH